MISQLVLMTLCVAAPNPSVAKVVEQVQAVYDSTVDLKAQFDQVYTFKVSGLKRSSSGRLYLKKSGRMRWDYEKPSRRHFVSDGETLWIYEPEEGQAFTQPLKGSQAASAMAFLLGRGDLSTEFDSKLLATPAGEPLQLQLVPKVSEGRFRRVVLHVDSRSFRVVGTDVEDPVGNINAIRFRKIQVNVGLPEAGFVFAPPSGTRVLRSSPTPSEEKKP